MKRKRKAPASTAADYSLEDDVTALAAARDLIVLLSGTRMGMDLLTPRTDAGGIGVDAFGARAGNMSAMELELGRIATARQLENDSLQEQVRNLKVRIEHLSQ